MEEKKNIRELAIQYFEGRILRKDEKLLFAYVGQSEENRATFRQWKGVDCIRHFRFRNNRRMGNFAAQDSHSRSYYPDAYCFKIPVIRMAASCCGCGYRDSDHRKHHRHLADFFLIKAGDVFCM